MASPSLRTQPWDCFIFREDRCILDSATSYTLAMPPPTPKRDIDWANLGFGFDLKVHGHVEVRHHQSTGKWTAPRLVANPDISVNGLSPGLNYGQQCYEGLKAFRTPVDTICIFRPQFHAARMCRSAASISLPQPPEDLLLKCLEMAVAANAEFVPPCDTEAYLYIRPVLFGASGRLSLGPAEETILAVYVQPGRPYHGSAAVDGLVLEDFDRAAPKGMGSYKVGGNYAPVWRHAARAQKLGYGITLHLDSATRSLVEEFSTSGFLGHKMTAEGQHVLVVPKTDGAIASATSDSMVWIAKRHGWLVETAALPFSTLSTLDEVVAVGTAAGAVPIRSITRLSTDEKYVFDGTDKHGGKLVGLARIMADMQRGRSEDTEGWCWEVTEYPSRTSSFGSSMSSPVYGLLLSTAIILCAGIWNGTKYFLL